MQGQDRVCLSVCTRCKPPNFTGPDHDRPGYRMAGALLDAVQDSQSFPLTQSLGLPLGLRFGLRGVRCMSQCKRSCVIALSGPAKYTLLFGDLEGPSAAMAVLTLAEQYARSADGYVPRDQRPEPLRAGILGRIPPLGHAGDAIDPRFTFVAEPRHHEETL